MATISVLESPEHSELACMAFLPNCCLVATGHEDASIRLWNLEINQSIILKSQHEKLKHTDCISCIKGIMWKKAEYLIAGSYDGKVSIWEISEQRTPSQNSKTLSSIFPQLKSFIDNTKAQPQSQFMRGQEEEVILTIMFDEARESILIGGNDKRVNVWSIRTQEHLGSYVGHTDSVTCMTLEQNLLFTGGDDAMIYFWNLEQQGVL